MKILKPTLLVAALVMCLSFTLSCAHNDDKMMMDASHNKMDSTMMNDSSDMKSNTPMAMEKETMQGDMDMSDKGDMKQPMEMDKKMME